jgi:RNA polymerase sigma-54 factor
MSSLRLQTSLKQSLVLTPQLRQRIEMLQMTSLELTDLIQLEMESNPMLEEVQGDEELQEISDKILDQNADGHEESFINGADKDFEAAPSPDFSDAFAAESKGDFGDEAAGSDYEPEGEEFREERSDSFEEIDFGREFQDYLDPGYKTQEIEYKEDAPSFEQFLTRSESLTEHLEWLPKKRQFRSLATSMATDA